MTAVPGQSAGYRIAATARLAMGDREGARQVLTQALKRAPEEADLIVSLADLLAKGQVDDAEALADATPTGQLQNGPLALSRARALAYLDAKRPADALGILVRLLSAAPEVAETHYLIARAYAAQGDARARDAFLAGWQRDPDTPLAGAVLAQVLETIPDDNRRQALAKEMERIHPEAMTPKVLGARLAADRGDLKQAIAFWRGLQTQAPDNPQVFENYLKTLLAADQGAEAQKTADAWIARHPEGWGIHLLMANYLAGKDRLVAAAPYYRRVLELKPDNPLALNNLALHLTSTDPDTARGYAERVLALYPDQSAIMDTAGTVRLAAGDTAGAVEVLTRAHQAAPSAPDIALHLAQALAASGESERAIDLLRPLVSARFDGQSQAKALLARL